MQIVRNETGINYRENPGAFFISAIINEIFNGQQRDEYLQAVFLYDKCFNLAKQNKISDARLIYEECCGINEMLHSEMLAWIMAFYGQRLCYYHYKAKQYNSGIFLTMKIVDQVRILHQKGYRYLFFVEIQQKLNLSRIYFELNKISLAISYCVDSLISIYDQAGNHQSEKLIGGVSESELLEITQYGMIIEVLSEACNRMFYKLKEDEDSLEKAMVEFTGPLLKINFDMLSPEPRYACINKFISLMNGLGGASEIQESDILFFIESQFADKKLSRVLNNYLSLAEA
jgi:hypothetical protein